MTLLIVVVHNVGTFEYTVCIVISHSDCLLLDPSYWQYLCERQAECITLYVCTRYCMCISLAFPVSETSPVMAMFCRTGVSLASERRADTIVHPADGPSLGVAP